MENTKKTLSQGLLLLTVAVLAVACGGGGGGGSSVGEGESNLPITTPAATYGIAKVSNALDKVQPPDLTQTGRFYNAYNAPRGFAFEDLNGDGCSDMVVAPTYFSQTIKLPIEVYAGDCKGGMTLATQNFITGAVPVTGSVNNIFIADFNGDGKSDILLIDQGLEDKDAMNPGFDGEQNKLLLSGTDGKLVLQNANFMDNNSPHFNHVSAIGDLNGDGQLDLVVVRLGGPTVGQGGVQVFYNDHGKFTLQPNVFPAEFSLGGSFETGGAAAADIDGDGISEIILASYSGAQEVVVLKWKQSSYIVSQKISIPPQYKDIGYFTDVIGSDGRGLGASGLAIADFNGDSRKDVVIIWEGANKSYLQFLSGASGSLVDATDAIPTAASGSGNPTTRIKAMDVNGDGIMDLVAEKFSLTVNELGNKSPYLVIGKDGKFQYHKMLGNMTIDDFSKKMGLQTADSIGVHVVDLNLDGKLDFFGVKDAEVLQPVSNVWYVPKTAFIGAIAN